MEGWFCHPQNTTTKILGVRSGKGWMFMRVTVSHTQWVLHWVFTDLFSFLTLHHKLCFTVSLLEKMH